MSARRNILWEDFQHFHSVHWTLNTRMDDKFSREHLLSDSKISKWTNAKTLQNLHFQFKGFNDSKGKSNNEISVSGSAAPPEQHFNIPLHLSRQPFVCNHLNPKGEPEREKDGWRFVPTENISHFIRHSVWVVSISPSAVFHSWGWESEWKGTNAPLWSFNSSWAPLSEHKNLLYWE